MSLRQDAFVARHRERWRCFDELVAALARRGTVPADAAEFPARYRELCHHYALARHRRYGSALLAELHDRVLRGHTLLYRRRGGLPWQVLRFLGATFPAMLRRHVRAFALAALLFVLPGMAMALACYLDPDLILTLLPAQQVAEFEQMYDPANRLPGRTAERAAASDFTMFGYYVMNNVGIGFRTFALGLLAGVGSAGVLVLNGLVIGAVAGYSVQVGHAVPFFDFVSGHSALELTAIVICGAAGLLLAGALLAPGRRRRREALKHAAREAVVLVGGAMLMLFAAAFVEAFWSSHHLLGPVAKQLLGAAAWLLLAAYFLFLGRGHAPGRG